MKMFLIGVGAILGLTAGAVAGDIQAKFTGPSGQGDLVYISKSTGVTNLHLTTSGISNVTYSAGGTAKFDGDITANGDIVGDNATIVTNMSLVEAGGFAAGSLAGLTIVITNVSASSTNVLTYTGGILTSATTDP